MRSAPSGSLPVCHPWTKSEFATQMKQGGELAPLPEVLV